MKAKILKAIKKIKRIFGIIGNCLIFPIVFPITISGYVKRIPFVSSVIFFVNLIVWYSFLLFTFGFAINRLGLSDNSTRWVAEISKNPYQYIRSSFFAWNLIILDLFYMVAIIKNWWNFDELKKDLSEFIYHGVEK